MRVFAIQHKPSGGYLPEVGRGYTQSIPCVGQIPRLFMSEGSAKCALTWWLKGWTTVTRTRDYFDEYDEVWHTEPILERKASDMAIVPLDLEKVA